MEPLLPRTTDDVDELVAQAQRLAGELRSILPSTAVRWTMARLVVDMNGYYSNLIEGRKTMPLNIDVALALDSSAEETVRNQELHTAHCLAEKALRERLDCEPETKVYSGDFLCWIHQEFFKHSGDEHLWAKSENGKKYRIEPGRVRDYQVKVGAHIPPDHNVLDQFLKRFETFYGSQVSVSQRVLGTPPPTTV